MRTKPTSVDASAKLIASPNETGEVVSKTLLGSGEFKLPKANLAEQLTALPVAAGTVAPGLRPDWGDVSVATQEFPSIGRTVFFRLMKEGRIRSVMLRHKGNIRGRRLVFLPSVRLLLMAEMEAQSRAKK